MSLTKFKEKLKLLSVIVFLVSVSPLFVCEMFVKLQNRVKVTQLKFCLRSGENFTRLLREAYSFCIHSTGNY